MLPGISLERAPPLTVPLRFLLTAPWFGLIAGLLLAWGGASLFASRWQPATLAVTHLLTLGFMGQAMLGALLQLLPVVAGTPVPHSRLVAAIAYPGLGLGTLLLASAFMLAHAWLFRAAVVVLALSFALYIGMAMWGIARQRPRDAASRTIASAIVGLAITVILGIVLASAFGWSRTLPLVGLTAAHATWGLVGWTVTLVLGASLVLVPMVQMTQAFPVWARRGLGVSLGATLLAWSVSRSLDAAGVASLLEWFVAAEIATVGVIVLRLQQHSRRRKQPDATFLLWRTSMLSLLGAVAVWAAHRLGALEGQWIPLVIGVLLIPGFAMCAIMGMLYRIVPFLLWLYLQLRVGGRPPTVKRILPDEWATPQMWVHRVALMALLAAAFGVGWLVRPAGGLLAASTAMLGVNLFRASLFTGRVLKTSPALPQGKRAGWRSLP
ncbi:MAG TPA: permease [Burkholderiales bacterium]|nr:permease [Burkholderiales bacterium]